MQENIKKGISPKFFFLSLGVIISLITSVATGLSLFFETLTRKMPDALNSYYEYGYSSYTYESMRTMMATLLIFFPIFLILSYFWWKTIKKGLENANATLFKWLMYVVLFLASLVIVVDLVILVNYFVSGEITERFIYKILGTILIAGTVWTYYYISLKNFTDKNSKNKITKKILFALSILIFGGLIVFGFLVMGSPKMQRAWRLDERRVQDLQVIQGQILNYWQQKGILPQALNDLKDPLSYTSVPLDPEFQKGKSYEYIPKDNLSFTLCADFSEVAPQGLVETGGGTIAINDIRSTSAYAPGWGGVNDSWNHSKGKVCFDRTIDTNIYKPFNEKHN